MALGQRRGNKRTITIVVALLVAIAVIAAALGAGLGVGLNKKNADADSSSADQNGGSSSSATPTATGNSGFGGFGGLGSTSSSNPSSTASSSSSASSSASSTSGLCTPTSTFVASADNPYRSHPRLINTPERLECINQNIEVEGQTFLSSTHTSVLEQAQTFADAPLLQYILDGGAAGSGLLDIAREAQQRLKYWAFAYTTTNDTKWVDRTWTEIQSLSGEDSSNNFPDWNPPHFYDVAELTAGFAFAYDWLYEAWTDTQRSQIRSTIIERGLRPGLEQYSSNGFWTSVNGNWNCACNGGLGMGALAIISEDTTGTAEQILSTVTPNFAQNCLAAVQTDGAWSETPNYWYFGTQPMAQFIDSYITATGSDQGLLTRNPALINSGLYHMFITGSGGKLFDYGDEGPTRNTATANPLFFFASQFDVPAYTLFQREAADSSDVMSLLWYNTSHTGEFTSSVSNEHFFNDPSIQIAAMRSGWEANDLYAGIKASTNQGHQTHGDLDIGTFVIDMSGQRFGGELGSGNYLSDGYFSSEDQDSDRWLYYRKRTLGQNTITFVNNEASVNQEVSARPTAEFNDNTDTAYFTTDMSSAYSSATSIKRGLRLLNQRQEILLQDEIVGGQYGALWSMHTNATISTSGSTATLSINGATMTARIVQGDYTWTTRQPVRLQNDPATPADIQLATPASDIINAVGNSQDQENSGITVLSIELPANSNINLQVVFSPSSVSSPSTPSNVPLDTWSLTSH